MFFKYASVSISLLPMSQNTVVDNMDSRQVEMILYESLRLYPPANAIARIALQDMKVENLFVPKGMGFWILILSIHLDPELSGETVDEFNPDRLAEGISNVAKHSCHSLMGHATAWVKRSHSSKLRLY